MKLSSFGVLFLLFQCGHLQVSSEVKPVYEKSDNGSQRRSRPYLESVGLLKINKTKTGLIGSILSKPNAKNGEKLERQEKDHHRKRFADWEDNNRIEEDRFPTLGDEVPSKVRPYKTSGEWATPAPESGVELGFTPVQTYIQVRKTNKVEHLPRSEAVNEAVSLDEVLNAHRLKEVLRTKKIQEVYSEEGYEDSAYDHGDHERHAEHGEGFSKENDGKLKIKYPAQHIHDIEHSETNVVPSKNLLRRRIPKVSRERFEALGMKISYMNDNIKPRKKMMIKDKSYHSTIPNTTQNNTQLHGRKQRRANRYPNYEKRMSNQQEKKQHESSRREQDQARPGHEQRKELKLELQQEQPPTKRDFVSPNGNFWSLPSVFEELTKSTKWGNNPIAAKTKQNDNKRTVNIPKTGVDKPKIAYNPTIGYIHSLTDAHYGTQTPMVRHRPKPIPSHVITLTEEFKPMASKKMYPGFEPRRLTKRIKRAYSEEEKISSGDSDKYEEELHKELDKQEKNIISAALLKLNATKDIDEVLPKSKTPATFNFKRTTPSSWRNTYDNHKYPYFFAKGIDTYSPLRYASHPREFPRKSGYGMEFYERRDREIECDPVSVNLDDIPKSNSTRHLTKQPGKEKRIVALGDKIQCLKIKYFGEDPLDSPFFKEDELKQEPSNIQQKFDEELLKYHSTYHYKPNSTMDLFIKEKQSDITNNTFASNDSKGEGTQEHGKYETMQPAIAEVNRTQNLRIIPVTEQYIPITSALPITGMRPPPMYQRPFPLSLIKLPPRPKSKNSKQRIHYKHNCLHPVTRMVITERIDEDHEIIFDCKDAIFVETIRWDGNKHIKIIPKMRRSDFIDALIDETKSPRAGEVIEGNSILLSRGKRATPSPVPARRKTKLFPNKSLLDKIIKHPTKKISHEDASFPIDLGDKSPDEVNKAISSSVAATIKTPTTPKIKLIPASTPPPMSSTVTLEFRQIDQKPLNRLTGRDFLDRYHKTKSSKSSGKQLKNEFWKVPEKKLKLESSKADERRKADLEHGIVETTAESAPSPTPVLLYIVDEVTGRGQWVPEEVSDPSVTPETESSTKGYTRASERQLKKHEARRKFFSKKLKKAL